jgi:tripartite-type tricarboxylate transporter receptor subunit TctC
VRALLVTLAVALAAGAAAAQYPAKPIHFVVPFPAGGTTDIAARAIAQPMSQALGQPIIIDNKPGGDGLIAGEAVAKAAPDGYSFLLATSTGLSFAPAAHKSMPYDPVADFTPIGGVGIFGFFLYVHDAVPARTLSELVAYAHAHPHQLNYGTTAATSMLATAQLAREQKLDMVHVPYKGDAPLITDLLAGRVQLAFAAGAALQYVKEGKLRVLATMLPSRSPLLPEVPTLPETGIASITITPWAGLFGPPNLPRSIVDRVSRELVNALARPDVREQLARLAFEGRSSSPDELAALVKEQLAVWRQASRDAGVQPE